MSYYDNKREENELINIIIGLSFPRANFPHPFYDLGYTLKGIEQSFINSTGNTVKPDLIIANDDEGYIILFEAKSGKNAEKTQLKNYENITSNDLIHNAGFNRNLLKNGQNIAYICYKFTFKDDKKIAAYKNLIKSVKEKYYYPVLVFKKDKGYLSLELNKFKDNKLNEITEAIIKIPTDRIPKFINFDQHSNKKQIKIEVIRNIIAYILGGKFVFSIEEILNDIISQYPGIEKLVGSDVKKAVKNKMMKVLREIRQEKPDYFEWNGSKKVWQINDILENPTYNQLKALKNITNINNNVDQMQLFE